MMSFFNEIASGFEKEPNDLKPYVKIDLEGIDSRTSAQNQMKKEQKVEMNRRKVQRNLYS